MHLLALAAGVLALSAPLSRAATEPTWNFNNDLQGWSVTAGVHAFEGAGIEPAQDNGTRAHDAAHSVFVLTSPEINFNLANVSAVDNVIDILWEGGKGNQNNSANPANLAAVTGYNGGTTNTVGQKGLGFRNLITGNYDFVDYDSADGGGVETRSYTQADLVANGVDPNASYVLDFFTTDDGGWGWTRLNQVNWRRYRRRPRTSPRRQPHRPRPRGLRRGRCQRPCRDQRQQHQSDRPRHRRGRIQRRGGKGP